MCRKHKKKKKVVLFKKRSFDEVIANFKVVCERCGSPLVVHGFRQKNPHKGQKEIIYAHCENNGETPIDVGFGLQRCPKFNAEIAFIERFF